MSLALNTLFTLNSSRNRIVHWLVLGEVVWLVGSKYNHDNVID